MNRNIISDELRLRQITTNLLSNAIKFTSEGCIIIRLEPDEAPEFFRLSVIDTGEGIPADKQQDIFREFRQLEDQDNRRFAGSGLGLAITRRLVKLFGGDIKVDSQPGEGSQFSVILPLKFADDKPDGIQRINYSGSVVVNLNNPILRAAVVELCNLWGLDAYDAQSSPKLPDHSDYPPPVLLVDLDPGCGKLADHQSAANTLLAQAKWRFIAVSSSHSTDIEIDPSQADSTDVLSAVLKAPISVESLNRTLCQESNDIYNQKTHPILESKTATKEAKKVQCQVLLVDDSLSNLAVGEALLKPLSCNVITAINGEAAIKKASEQHYDIIFMDLAMPVMDGLAATKIIRETPGPNQETVIVALTANAFSEDRERCLANGMTDYLSKPIVRDQLIEIVNRYSKKTSKEDIGENESAMANDNTLADGDILDRTVLEKLKKEISAEALPTILGIYLDELEKRTEMIQQHHLAGDIAALGGEAHALKSSSASFGALPLAETARELELAARESNQQHIDLHIKSLQPLAQQSIQAINAYLADLNSGNIEK